MYIHKESESFEAKIFKLILLVINRRKKIEKVIKNKKFPSEPAAIPRFIINNFNVKNTFFQDRNFWTIQPKNISTEKIVIYIHGGAYIANMSYFHWSLIAKLAKKSNATFIIPNYETAPFAGYFEAHHLIQGIYLEVLKNSISENIVIMGDSAGGGFSLSFAMSLRDDDLPQPSQIILLAPWLDISLSNPNIAALEKKDKMLSVSGIKMAGKLFAKEMSTVDHRLSPVYGNVQNLGKISLFAGTHDILFADILKLKNKLEEDKIEFNYYEYPKMFHVWMAIVNLPESQTAIKQISDLINSQE